MKNPWKFDKKVYWDRRKKGLAGQVPALGSLQHRRDARKMARLEQATQLNMLMKGRHSER